MIEKVVEKKYRIMGVDPGTNFLGYAVLEIENKKFKLITMSILTLTHVPDAQEKLKRIFEKMCWVIDTFAPQQFSIEQPFFGKNPQSMLKLGRAQGVAIAAAMTNNVTVNEYSAKEIKKSVVGNGNASKEQVAAMVGRILNQTIEPSFYDASDALAAALCHYYASQNVLGGGKKSNSWASFMKNNPDKVIK